MAPGESGVQALEDELEMLALFSRLPAMSVPFAGVAASGTLYSGRCILQGLTLHNLATTGGNFLLHDGLDASGAIVFGLYYGAGNYDNHSIGTAGVVCEIGVYLDISLAAPWTGALFLIPLRWNR